MRKIIGLVLLVLGVMLLSAATIVWAFHPQPLLSPLTTQPVFHFVSPQTAAPQQPKIVYGFLPYWNLDKVVLQPEVTNLSYFSLVIGANGTILTQTPDGLVSQGFTDLKSSTLLNFINTEKKKNGKFELVFSQMSNDDIAAFVMSDTAHQHFFTMLDSVLLAYPVDGINVDIEYNGPMSAALRDHFTAFLQDLQQYLHQHYTHMSLSVDMYSTASSNQELWDLDQIGKFVDHVIVMAYDFHHPSSIVAGPVAPLFGGQKSWDHDITLDLRALLSHVPKEKILLGIPFYGYEWQTTSTDPQATTYPNTGTTATAQHIQDLLAQKQQLSVEEHWNEDALSPYLSYEKNGQHFLVYYENSRSLSYKLDLVNQLNLGGIAIWALGYENNRELWDVIHQKMQN